ncbi:MAG: sulfite exporter TauE/SafE family protein [Methanococcoides sp.]|nr:sulfite exporter TauE/SafE family protein [Methanococcoides sp.]
MFGFGSGALGYARKKLIDFRCAKHVLIVSIPSAIAGVILGGFIGPLFLLTVFGAGMLLLSIVFILPEKKILPKHPSLYDQKAHTHPWRFHFEKIDILFYILSSIGGLFVGMVSSGLGEANEYNLEQRLKMPPAIASGTSVFIVIVTALIASFVHVLDIFVSSDTSFLADVFSIIIFAGPGVILGAQLGVRASQLISHQNKKVFLSLIFLIVSILTFIQVLYG